MGWAVPYRFEFDGINAILRVNYQGEVTDSCLVACYRATPAAVIRSNPRAVVIDLSAVTRFDVSRGTIHQLADLPPTVSDPATPRIIVAPTPYLFGMSRMFQMLGAETRPRLHVVNSLDEAHDMLGVSDQHYAPLSMED